MMRGTMRKGNAGLQTLLCLCVLLLLFIDQITTEYLEAFLLHPSVKLYHRVAVGKSGCCHLCASCTEGNDSPGD